MCLKDKVNVVVHVLKDFLDQGCHLEELRRNEDGHSGLGLCGRMEGGREKEVRGDG